jgi:4-amino-4-deoxy-L-arabinose transferase-like glycosyltransferase
MSAQSGSAPDNLKPDYHKWVLLLLGTITLFRVISLFFSPLNLHGDEAQYWSWSRNFDWGYFSKPPMIAWMIGATTSLFGNEEWAVRLSSPLIHPITAYVLFRTGQFLFSARAGFFATCLYFLMPAVWLSSAIVSTDVALLMFWALALNAWAHLRETPTLKWASLLGLWIGLGMLSKYAMLFFIVAMFLVTLIDKKTRNAVLSKNGLIISTIAVVIISPNLLWNAANDFATVGHTASNANLGGVPFHPDELLEFWGSQFGVFGPLTILLMFTSIVLAIRGKLDKTALALAIFALVPFIVISAQALISRANANWAVTTYIAGCLLAAYGIDQLRGNYSLLGKAGILLNLIAGLTFSFVSLSPSLTDKVGLANSVKRLRAWPQTVAQIEEFSKAGHEGRNFIALATDNRLSFFDFTYYSLEEKSAVPLRSWLYSKHINHHAEASAPLTASTVEDGPILVINYYKNYEKYFREDFAKLVPIETLEIDLGGGKTRIFYLWAGYGYTPTENYR